MGKHIHKRERAVKPKFGGKKPIKQLIWEYMRRNKSFGAKDILLIIEGSATTLFVMINYLQRAGYIVCDETRSRLEKTYLLTKDTGIYAPMYHLGRFYDFNTKEEKQLKKEMR